MNAKSKGSLPTPRPTSEQRFPTVRIRTAVPPMELFRFIPLQAWKQRCAVPLRLVGDTCRIAIADERETFILDEVRFAHGYQVEAVIASRASIMKLLESVELYTK